DLEVKHGGASLIAREVWGAIKGLETFSQLVYQDDSDVYLVNRTYIHDYPRFPHRGVLLDTARHYLNKDTLITNLEIMAQNKMNVFHWHIVDDNSFPFQSKMYPELSDKPSEVFSNGCLISFAIEVLYTTVDDFGLLLDIIAKIGSQREQGSGYIVWQEVFDNGVKLKPDTIVQIWSGDAFDIGRVTGAGFRTLYSTCWYLDYINYGQDWDKYYLCENIGQMLEDYRVQNQTLIMGGDVCLWTEFADDGSVLPRL
ncbi:hypothetical protein LSH36_37g04000, partial [Paralvinella palmiformis]